MVVPENLVKKLMQDYFNLEFPLTHKLVVTIWQNAQKVTLMMKGHVRKMYFYQYYVKVVTAKKLACMCACKRMERNQKFTNENAI